MTLFVLDVVVVSILWDDFNGLSPSGWFGIFWVAVANAIMLPKVSRAVFGAIGVVLAVVLVLGAVIAGYLLLWSIPTYAGLVICGVVLVYALFTKLDTINANLVRANELKERELGRVD